MSLWIVEPEWHCGVMVKASKPCSLMHPHSYFIYTKCLSTFICCGWAYRCTLALYCLCRWGWVLEKLGKAEPKWCCGARVEAANPCRLHLTFTSYVYKVFEHIHILWMGIWVHPYTVMPVQVGLSFWKNGLRRLSPSDFWCHSWGYKSPLTASHIHIICIKVF